MPDAIHLSIADRRDWVNAPKPRLISNRTYLPLLRLYQYTESHTGGVQFWSKNKLFATIPAISSEAFT